MDYTCLIYVMNYEFRSNEKIPRKMCKIIQLKRPTKSHHLNSKPNMKCHSKKHNLKSI